ncbi:hypothetical protein V8E55_011976 [Tylopilus felleus]
MLMTAVVSTRKTSAFFYFRLTHMHRCAAVVRGSNAYGARKQRRLQQSQQQQPNSAGTSATNSLPPKTDIPQVSVNIPDGRTVAQTEMRLTTSLDKQWCIACIQNISSDLTSQVVREDHDPIASGGFANTQGRFN